MSELNYIKLEQPVGDMFLVKMKATQVASIAASKTRKSYNDSSGIQRKLDPHRIKSIAEFCKTKNAMFPTPIILSASSDYFVINEEENTLTIPMISEDENKFCSIVDGQHRLEGLKESGVIGNFELLVSFVFDTDPSKDAFLFSIINGNQKPVSRSLIYDLYGLSRSRTVEKTCNKIMRALNGENFDIKSELSGKIKMLGYKDEFSQNGIVSQAAMIKNLMKLITDKSERDNIDIEFGRELEQLDSRKYIFRKNFIEGNDELIIQENIDFFNAWMKKLKEEKESYELNEYELFEKTIGFSVSYRIFRILYLSWEDSRKYRVRDIEDLYLRKTYYSTESRKNFYNLILSDMFANFFKLKLDNNVYSSSESGVNDLEIDLVAILWDNGMISKNLVYDIYSKEEKIEKIKARKNYLQIVARDLHKN
ncbi:DGQHR domain-containing protein [Streptococcus ilei]|jgi:DGQHR domain protein|uniref:DGQHR domain-containing protein n=1 Tax=Streptococcus TaxID=1301 RepID=UPI0003B93685|nr:MULTISPECIES: DGQHR domain-containing protein [Streptococcus]AGY41052.1 hypothetical protein N596_07550 [Streptococcus ilei]